MKKKLMSLVLALIICLTLCIPSFAVDRATDVASGQLSYAVVDVLTEEITSYLDGTAIVYEHNICNSVTGDVIKIIISEGSESRTITTYENNICKSSFVQNFTGSRPQPAPLASPGFEDIDEMYMSSVGLWGTLYRNVYTYEDDEHGLRYSAGDALSYVLTGIASCVLGGVVLTDILIAFGCSVIGKNLDYAINGSALCEYDENQFEVWATNASTNKLGLRTSRTYVYQIVEGFNSKENRHFRETVYSRTDGDTRTNSEMMVDGIINVASGVMG